MGKYTGDKWGGKYLRAPDIYWKVLEKAADKLVRLGDYYRLIPKHEGLPKDLRIEKEFLRPVIKSPREIKNIMVRPQDLRYEALMCHSSKDELRHEGKTGVLRYIQWGEEEGYNEGATCSSRNQWWSIPDESGTVFWGKELRHRLATFIAQSPMLADCRLYVATVPLGFSAMLNTAVSIMFSEVAARQYGGGGVGQGA